MTETVEHKPHFRSPIAPFLRCDLDPGGRVRQWPDPRDTRVHSGGFFHAFARIEGAFLPRYFVGLTNGISCRRIGLIPPIEPKTYAERDAALYKDPLWGDTPIDYVDCAGIDLSCFTYPNTPIPFPTLSRYWSVYIEGTSLNDAHLSLALIEATGGAPPTAWDLFQR